jgi:hypothetical protein
MTTADRERQAAERLLVALRRLDQPWVPGPRRLEAAVGGDFARLLVFGLSGAYGLRARGLRGRFSP